MQEWQAQEPLRWQKTQLRKVSFFKVNSLLEVAIAAC